MGAYYDEIEIEDMTWDDVKKVYHYPCPCGDRFEISKTQLANYEDIATCPSCSLIIRVIYDPTILRTTKSVPPLYGSIPLEVGFVIKVSAWDKWTLNLVKLYKTFRAGDFWEPAKPSSYTAETRPKNGEVPRTVSACKVVLWFPIFWLCYFQIDGNRGTMAAAMTFNGTPNDLIQILNPISITVLIPILNHVIYTFLRRKTIDFSPIKRIAAGFIVAGTSMTYAGVPQHYIYQMIPCTTIPPQNALTPTATSRRSHRRLTHIESVCSVGIGNTFVSITSRDYALTKALRRMKSPCFHLEVPANREDRIGWLFGSFAIAAWVAGALFMWTFRELHKAEADLNEVGCVNREGFADEHPVENRA